MRRALAILKYVSAILCGLLLLAWLISDLAPFAFVVSRGRSPGSHTVVVALLCGNIDITRSEYEHYPAFWSIPLDQYGLLDPGALKVERWNTTVRFLVAIPFLLTVFAPVFISLLTRLPLWSYFASTALVAAELAYYLRA